MSPSSAEIGAPEPSGLVAPQPHGLVEHFIRHRNQADDLYDSERRFLPWLSAEATSVLDVGCAAGGFADVWRAFNPDVRYTGVDISEALVAAARERHPDETFVVGDGAAGLPFPDRFSDTVAALGWLHWEPRYADALTELWRLTGRRLFFDVRLHAGRADLHGTQELPGGGTTPYICFSWRRFEHLLHELEPGTIHAYGYEGPPAVTVRGMPPTVCFAAFVLERGQPPMRLDVDLPRSITKGPRP